MRTKYLLRLLTAALVSAAASAKGAEATNTLRLDEIVEEVKRNNPSLKAARASWEAMKQRVPQARAWEDPTTGVDIERMGTTRPDTFTDNEWMIAQQLPLSGRNRRQGKAALADAAAAFEEFRRRELDVVARARAAYYRLANAAEQLGLSRKNEDLLRQFLEISRARYEAGRAQQSDVLLAETDLAKLLEDRYHFELQIVEAQSELNALMNRPAGSPLAPPAQLAFFPIQVSAEDLNSKALSNRPEMLMNQKRVEAAKSRLDAARRYWIPDPEIRVEARQYNGQGGGIQEYDTGIFFNLPWINRSKYKAAIAEAGSTMESAELQLEAAAKETLQLIRTQLKRVETFHHHTELFRERIIPLAEQTVKASQAAYETDRGSFLELIMAQRTVREVESTYWNHLTDYLSAVAELEATTGIDLRAHSLNQKDR